MRLMLAVLTVLVSSNAVFAQGAGRNAEVAAAVASLLDGSVGVNQAVNRIQFAGAEAWASHQLSLQLRKLQDPHARSTVLEALGQLATSDSETESLLEEASASGDTFDRLNAIAGLGRMKRKTSLPALEALAIDKLPGIRAAAAKAIGRIAEPKACKHLLDIAKKENEPAARNEQLRAVGFSRDKKLKNQLLPFLKSDSESTRLVATQALCRLGAREGLASAKNWLTATETEQRYNGVMLFEGFPAKEALPALMPMLQDPEIGVRAAAGRILAQAGERKAVVWLLAQSEAAKPEDKGRFESEIEKLRLPDNVRAEMLKKVRQ